MFECKNITTIYCLLLLILILNIHLIHGLNNVGNINNPNSPCPNLFQYRYNGNEWYGLLNLKSIITALTVMQVHNIHVKIILSQKGRILSNYLGEIEPLHQYEVQDVLNKNININNNNNNNQNFDNNNYEFMYKIKFPNNQHPPKVTQIFVNNRLICFGSPETGVIVTVINLEHTTQFSIPTTKTATTNRIPVFLLDTVPQLPIMEHNISPSRVNNKICGQSEISKIMISNKSVSSIIRGSWPWLAAIYVNNLTTLSYRCSGNIISSRIIISAAHCFYNYKPNDLLIFLGRFNLNDWNEDNSLAVSSDNIFIHPDFDENLKTFDADIAIITLKNDIRFNNYIRPVCLWTGSTILQYIEDESGIVVGWSSSSISSNLNETDDNKYKNERIIAITKPKMIKSIIISNEKCEKLNENYKNILTKRNFCGENENNQGFCNGYSGSGLMIIKNNRWVLRGIVSGSLPLDESRLLESPTSPCGTDRITIYTDVAKFLDWIVAFLI